MSYAASVGLWPAFAEASAVVPNKSNNPLNPAASFNAWHGRAQSAFGATAYTNDLPPPTGAYDLVMRMHGPDQRVFDGEWNFSGFQKR
jgi:hypothetical protein